MSILENTIITIMGLSAVGYCVWYVYDHAEMIRLTLANIS